MTSKIAQQYIEGNSILLADISKKIWDKAELPYKESFAAELMANTLKDFGFEVETNYAGLKTAIRATWGSGKPVIGFLGEYDALPGMSQKITTTKEAIVEGEPGHGCGHNLLGVGHLGAAIGMKKEMEERNLSGTLVFYGCPAEEALTGKVFMAREGAFKELDMFFAWHPATHNVITVGTMTAMNSVKFHFKGVTAHAGGDPHNGRSALDAVELMNVGANYLREHVTSDVRLHYTITNGGSAPNIVPDTASVWYYVRALSREAVVDTYNRLIKVANGAATMTETKVEVEFLGGCYNTLQNKSLAEVVYATMNEVDLPVWTEDELKFAAELEKGQSNTSGIFGNGEAPSSAIHQGVYPIVKMDAFGSTDVGDAQHIAPGIFFATACSNVSAAGHSWNNTACYGSSIGQKGMIHASKVMAVAGIKALEDPSIIEKAKAEFDEVMKNKEYVCPIPQDVKAPN